MSQKHCPHCYQSFVALDFMEGSKLAKCHHCGAVVETDHICPHERENDTTLPNDSSASPNDKPPGNAYLQMHNDQNGQLQLFLPQLGLNVISVFMVIIPLIMLAFMVYMMYSFLPVTDTQTLIKLGGAAFFSLVIVWFIMSYLNYVYRTEELVIADSKLYLTENNPFPIPLLTESSRSYNLADIKEVTCYRGIQIDDPAKVYLYLDNDYDQFFKSETLEGKIWLAKYLDTIIRNARVS